MGRRVAIGIVVSILLSACGWPQSRFDAGRTANNSFERAIGVGNVANLIPSWSSDADPLGWSGEPLVRSGRVIESSGHRVRALDATTGAEFWSIGAAGTGTDVLASIRASAVGRVAGRGGDVVFIGEADRYIPGRGFGTWGSLSARDAASGTLLWEHPIGAASGVLLFDGRGYARVNRTLGDSDDFVGLVAFEPSTGSTLFRVPVLGGAVVGHGETVFVSNRATVIAIPSDGCGVPLCAPTWSAVTTSSADDTTVSVAAAAGQLYASNEKGLWVFNASGCGAPFCSPLWTAPGSFSLVAVTRDRVFATTDRILDDGDGIAPMKVFDANGCGQPICAPLWTTSIARRFGPPSVANGVVYTTANGGPTEAWPASGCGAPVCDPLWSRAGSWDGVVGPIVADGRLYIGSDHIETYALPASSG